MGTEPLYRYAVAGVTAILPIYLIRLSIFGIPTNVLEVCITGVVLSGLLQKSVRESWKQALRDLPRPILISSMLFFLSAVVSTYISGNYGHSLGILKGWIVIPLVYAFALYAETRRQVVDITPYIVTSGVVVSILGLLQLGALERIRGPYDAPNSLALFIAPLIILASINIVGKIGPRRTSYLFAAIVMSAALVATQSIGGVVAVLVSLGLLGLRFRAAVTYKWLMLGSLVLTVLLALLFPKISYLVTPGSSAYVRLQLWSVSVDMIREHPILGIGLGEFEPLYQKKLHERFARSQNSSTKPLPEFVFRDPHNWVLSFWLNIGLLGLVSFGMMNFYVLYKDKLQSPYSFVLIAILIFGLVDTVYWKNDLAILWWILIVLQLHSAPSLFRQIEG